MSLPGVRNGGSTSFKWKGIDYKSTSSWWELKFISIIHQLRKQSWLELFDWDCID